MLLSASMVNVFLSGSTSSPRPAGNPVSWRRHVPCWCFYMRDIQTIETELMEISAIPDDLLKLERIIAWCASHPDEVPFALHQLLGRRDKHPPPTSKPKFLVPIGESCLF